MSDSGFDIVPPSRFSFRQCLAYMARSSQECLFVVERDHVTRMLRAGSGKRLLLRISCPDDRVLRVATLRGEAVSEEERAELTRYVREWFDLDRDLDPLYRAGAEDQLLGPLLKQFDGLRMVGIPDLFEAVCWAIVGQQVNLSFAYKLKQRLVERYSVSEEWEGSVYHVFPHPERFEDTAAEELMELQLSRGKAAAILEVAARMRRGELSRKQLLALPDPSAVDKELTSIRGIGPWTAQYVRMRCLRDRTALPIGDVGLQNAVKKLLAMERKPSAQELRTLFEPWSGWEAYVTFYLWRTMD